MKPVERIVALIAGIVSCAALAACARAPAVAVPSACGPQQNARIADLIARGVDAAVDGVMVCGTTFAPSRPQRAGPHGGHALIPLRVPVANGASAIVEVVTNDALDGVVTAPRGAHVAAYGQYYRTTARQRPFVAGIHETHCATHRGGADGWVVVDGRRYGC